jgi:hypothetical protein
LKERVHLSSEKGKDENKAHLARKRAEVRAVLQEMKMQSEGVEPTGTKDFFAWLLTTK